MNIERARARRQQLLTQQEDLIAAAEARGAKTLTQWEHRQFDELQAEFKELSADIAVEEARQPARSNQPILPTPDGSGRFATANGGIRLSPGAQGWVDTFVRARNEARSSSYVGALTLPVPVGGPFMKGERPRYLSDAVSRQVIDDGNVASYLRESDFVSRADVVPRGDTKPETDLELVRESRELQVVAHLLSGIANQDLADFSSLATIVGLKLVEGIKLALDRLIVNGDNSNFIGALDVNSNVATVAFSTDVLTTIRKARTSLLNSNAEPGSLSIALNPTDVEALDLLEDTSNRPLFQPDGPTSSNQRRVWDLGVIESPAVAAGTALAGDFQRAARLFTDGNAVLQADPYRGFRVNETDLRCEIRANVGWTAPHLMRIVDLTA